MKGWEIIAQSKMPLPENLEPFYRSSIGLLPKVSIPVKCLYPRQQAQTVILQNQQNFEKKRIPGIMEKN